MIESSIPVEAIEDWLRGTDRSRLKGLWEAADGIRKARVGTQVHLRGLLEISNHCVRSCAYCGLRKQNHLITRYRLSEHEILEAVDEVVRLGYGTVVMQSGEDYGISAHWLAGIIERIKHETPLAVTLSLGERPEQELDIWKKAGADRYLLRFETSDADLYRRIHPPLPGQDKDRFFLLNTLRQLGYEVGSGVMIGIPGQTFASLAEDIDMFRKLDLDMVGIGPYIPNPNTPLGELADNQPVDSNDQVPCDDLMAYKVLALTRIVCPDSNIPVTTALGTLDPAQGRAIGLDRGANVIMPNVTPGTYREQYEIYPGKPGRHETSMVDVSGFLDSIGRKPGIGPGGRIPK